MTLQRIIQEVWESLGEPSDLDFWKTRPNEPDTSSEAWKQLVSVINEGILALSTWKWPNGRQIRMRHLEDSQWLQVINPVGQVKSLGSFGLVEVGQSLEGELSGKMVKGKSSGSKGIVLTGVKDGFIGVVNKKGEFQVGEALEVYGKRFGLGSKVLEVVGVNVNGSELDLATEWQWAGSMETGVPTSFRKMPRGFEVDVWPDSGVEMEVRVARAPKEVLEPDEEPELPVQFHWGLVLWGKWWGLERGLETNDAYAVRKDLEDFMQTTRTEYDLQDEWVKGQMTIQSEGV